MKEDQQPGIQFVDLALTRLHFECRDEELPETLPLGLSVDYKHQIDEENGILVAILTWDLFRNLPEKQRPPVEFQFTMQAVFRSAEGAQMSLEDFARGHAPGHMVPFARELISNITTRSPLPTLRIGPINVLALIEKGTASLEATQRKKETMPPDSSPDES